MAGNEELQAQYKQLEDYRANMANLESNTAETGDQYDSTRQGIGQFGSSAWGGTAAQVGSDVTNDLAIKLRRLEHLMGQLSTHSGEVATELQVADTKAEASMEDVLNG